MTTIRAGSTATVTNTATMVTATSALRDGVAVRKPDGEIAGYLPAKPRSTTAGPTCIRGDPTTITRTREGGSLFGAQSLRFTAASWFAKAQAAQYSRFSRSTKAL